MIGENRQLVTNEPVEVGDFKKITDHFRGIHRIYPNSVKENRRMSACNRLDLQTLGSQLVMPKNLADHCMALKVYVGVIWLLYLNRTLTILDWCVLWWGSKNVEHPSNILEREGFTWEDLCNIQLRNQQTCIYDNHNWMRGRLIQVFCWCAIIYFLVQHKFCPINLSGTRSWRAWPPVTLTYLTHTCFRHYTKHLI